MSRTSGGFRVLPLIAVLSTARLIAGTYDLVRDFQGAPFSYGYYPISRYPFTQYSVIDRTSHPGAYTVLRSGSFPANPPYVAVNTTGKPLDIGLSFLMPPDQLHLHPGAAGEYTVVRFFAKAGTEGEHTIVGQFTGLDAATTDVHILHAGVSLFDGAITGKGSVAAFNIKVSLITDDVIDFICGYGADKDYTSDSTGLSGTITSNAFNHTPPANGFQPPAPAAQTSTGVITTVFGADWLFPSQPLPAAQAPLGQVAGVTLDASGNLYVSDASNNMVMKVTPDGVLSVVAGNGEPSPTPGGAAVGFDVFPPGPRFSGDGGPAVKASLSNPGGLAVDRFGNLYIADTGNNRVRKVTPDGIITTVASNGDQFAPLGYPQLYPDGYPAVGSSLLMPVGVALDGAGVLYIAELNSGILRKVASDGILKSVTVAHFDTNSRRASGPTWVASDRAGNIYTEGDDYLVLAPDGSVQTIKVQFPSSAVTCCTGLSSDVAGNLYLAGGDHRIYTGHIESGVLSLSVFAGNGTAALSGDGGKAIQASLNGPQGVAADTRGNVYIADTVNQRVRKVNTGNITTFAGNGLYRFSGDGGPAANAAFNHPAGMAMDASGNLLIADSGNNRIRRIAPDLTVTTVAGNGTPGFAGDGGPATAAELNAPESVALDAAGNLYIADFGNFRVRKVSNGTITTVPGPGQYFEPHDVAVDSTGRILIPCGLNCYAPDTPPNVAVFPYRVSAAVDSAGNIYLGDPCCGITKMVKGVEQPFAGGQQGFSGDGGPATSAKLTNPGKIATDKSGNVYFVDYSNNRVRKVDAGGIITSVAGGSFGLFAGDGGLGTNATLDHPRGLAINRAGDLYIADTGNHRIRAILANPPSAQASPSAMLFAASANGAVPAPQKISIQSSVPGVAYSVSSSDDQYNWLAVQPSAGFTPATLLVTADPTALDPGSHTGTITITIPNANPTSFTVTVTFLVGLSLPPKLSVDSGRLSLIVNPGQTAAETVTVGNAGGGTLNFIASAATDSGVNWLTVTPASAGATPVAPSRLTLTADPGTLSAGIYRGTVTIAADTGEQSNLAVTMLVSPAQGQLLLSQTGMSFQAAPGAAPPLAQTLSVLNRGQGSLSWTASARSDANWLSISPDSGSVARPMLDAAPISVSADPSGLAPGLYYGRITVTGGASTARTVTVILNVAASPDAAGPQIQPAGLIFTGRQGAAPGSQNLVVRNAGTAPLAYNSARLTLDGADWLQYVPQRANVASAQPQPVVVQPGFAGMTAGVHDGEITFLFGDGSVQVVRVSSVVAGPGCTPSRLVMLPISVEQVFAPTQNLPVSLEVQVVDDCGAPLTADRTGAAVTVSFSNGDQTTDLVPTGGGYWSNTWQPLNNGNGPVYLTLTASLPLTTGGALTAASTLEADVAGSANVPVPAALLNAASRQDDGTVAPGSLVSIAGFGLADAAQAAGLPWSTSLGNAQVQLGTGMLPLLSASSTQISGQVPFDAPVNSEAQVTVQHGAAMSLPRPVLIAQVSPAVFSQDGSGQGAGIISDAAGGLLNTPDNPAHAGDTVVISCTGLGTVTPDGTGVDAAIAVTIGGQPAQVVSAVLVAEMPGVYQVSAMVPDGVSGDGVAVVVAAAGRSSPPVTMSVQ